jgi:hypothetical protein
MPYIHTSTSISIYTPYYSESTIANSFVCMYTCTSKNTVDFQLFSINTLFLRNKKAAFLEKTHDWINLGSHKFIKFWDYKIE